MKANELQVGGHFYLKDDQGVFHHCQIFAEELKDLYRRTELKMLTEKYSKENRLFIRLNAPFKSFA